MTTVLGSRLLRAERRTHPHIMVRIRLSCSMGRHSSEAQMAVVEAEHGKACHLSVGSQPRTHSYLYGEAGTLGPNSVLLRFCETARTRHTDVNFLSFLPLKIHPLRGSWQPWTLLYHDIVCLFVFVAVAAVLHDLGLPRRPPSGTFSLQAACIRSLFDDPFGCKV